MLCQQLRLGLKRSARLSSFSQVRNFARQSRRGNKRHQLVPKDAPRQNRNGGGRRSGLLFKAVGVLGFCFTGTMYMYYVLSVGKRGRTDPDDWDDLPSNNQSPPSEKHGGAVEDDPWKSQPDWSRKQDGSLEDRNDPVWGSSSSSGDNWSEGNNRNGGDGKWA